MGPKIKIELKYPITCSGVPTSVLHMRRPVMRDMVASARSGSTDIDREISLFANLCEVEPKAIEEMDLLIDYAKLQEVYRGFSS